MLYLCFMCKEKAVVILINYFVLLLPFLTAWLTHLTVVLAKSVAQLSEEVKVVHKELVKLIIT